MKENVEVKVTDRKAAQWLMRQWEASANGFEYAGRAWYISDAGFWSEDEYYNYSIDITDVMTLAEAPGAWLRIALGKPLAWRPTRVGTRGGRKIYLCSFEDGTEETYFIDFDAETVEIC